MTQSLEILGWVLLFFILLGALAFVVAWSLEVKR